MPTLPPAPALPTLPPTLPPPTLLPEPCSRRVKSQLILAVAAAATVVPAAAAAAAAAAAVRLLVLLFLLLSAAETPRPPRRVHDLHLVAFKAITYAGIRQQKPRVSEGSRSGSPKLNLYGEARNPRRPSPFCIL